MRSLIEKELRSLTPFLALIIFIILLSWVYLMLSEFPDQYPLSKLLEHDAEEQIVSFVVAFALASGLLIRESEEGTLSFLDALPVSRARIFFSKFLLGLAVLWMMPISDLLLKGIIHAWSRTSLETHFQWQPLLMSTFLNSVSCFVYLSIGLALSFLRRFGLLVLGLLVCTYLLLQESHFSSVSLINIFSLDDPVFRGQHWLLPGKKLIVQLGLGVICLAISYWSFQRMGDATQRLIEKVKRKRSSLVLAGILTALLVLIWAGIIVYFIEKTDVPDKNKVHYAAWTTSRAQTARYQFVYPENQAQRASQLIGRADEAEAKVRRFLGAQPVNHIAADLTGSAPGTGGQAHWKKVQMDLGRSDEDINSLVAVLAHETTHVYISQESQLHLEDDFNSTRFFHEGLASYVEHHLFQPPGKLLSQRRVAAAWRARNQVKVEELFNDNLLTEKRDADLVYPLGEMFVAAIVKRYGEAAPGRLVRSFARANRAKGLSGFALWQDAFQSCGYNLSAVEDTFYAELDRVVAEQKPWLAALPRVRGVVEKDPKRLIIRPHFEGRPPGVLVCRVRARSNTPPRLYEDAYVGSDGTFWVDKTGYPDRSFWYQLGWRVHGASQPIYESWVEVPQN